MMNQIQPPQVDPFRLWRELLAMRLPNPACPMCAGSDWREIEGPVGVGVDAIGFVCANCGYIRLHSRDL